MKMSGATGSAMAGKTHTNRSYEDELTELRDRVLLMAGRVEKMIADSVRALVERDSTLAAATIEADHFVNRAEVEADEMCLQLLARRQPMASDLRFITLALKMVTDLERIADCTVSINRRVIELNRDPQLRPGADLEAIAALVQSMIRDAIDALVSGDTEKARDVIARDREVDDLYHQHFRDVLRLMTQDATTVERGIRLQTVAKHLERIGDHGTNLAELVVFMVKGKDVRHVGKMGADT